MYSALWECKFWEFSPRNVECNVSKNTTHIIVPEDPDIAASMLKYKKDAPQLKIINESALCSLLIELTNNPEFDLVTAKDKILSQKYAERKAELEANKQLWMDKHSPKTLEEVVGNEAEIRDLKHWLRTWQHNMQIDPNFRRGCLICGPSGIGKTIIARLACQKEGYDTVETAAGNQRGKNELEKFLSETVSCKAFKSNDNDAHTNIPTLQNTHVAVVMDELEAMNETINKGGMQSIAKYLKTTNTPMICICETSSINYKVRPILNSCYLIKINKPSVADVVKRLKEILVEEELSVDDSVLEHIVRVSECDVRQSIISLEMYCRRLRNSLITEDLST